jgi:hypothetical protein
MAASFVHTGAVFGSLGSISPLVNMCLSRVFVFPKYHNRALWPLLNTRSMFEEDIFLDILRASICCLAMQA